MEGIVVHATAQQLLGALPDGVAALVFADPPHCTGRLFRGSSGWERDAEIAFSDRWHERIDWSAASERLRKALKALAGIYGETPQVVYAAFLGRFMESARRVLDARGSLFLHISLDVYHYVRVVADAVFGRRGLRNVIVWHKTGGGRARSRFPHKYDLVLWLTKGRSWRFFADAVRVPYKETSGYARGGIVSRSGKRYLPHPLGTIPDDVWDIPMVNPLSSERVGYPTQKPEALLERILLATTKEGDIVVDAFCGSGTTGAVAARLARRFILGDASSKAVERTSARLAQRNSTFAVCSLSDINKYINRLLKEGRNRRSESEGSVVHQEDLPDMQGSQGVA